MTSVSARFHFVSSRCGTSYHNAEIIYVLLGKPKHLIISHYATQSVSKMYQNTPLQDHDKCRGVFSSTFFSLHKETATP